MKFLILLSRSQPRVRAAAARRSLGGVESLIEQPAIMSFYELTSEERLQIGIKGNLIADLAQALDRAFADP